MLTSLEAPFVQSISWVCNISRIFPGQGLFSQFGNWKHLESSFNFPCDPSRKNDECSFLPADRADRRPTHAPACDLHPFVEGQKVQFSQTANRCIDSAVSTLVPWFFQFRDLRNGFVRSSFDDIQRSPRSGSLILE